LPALADLEAKYFPQPFSATAHSQDTAVIPHVDGDAYFSAIAEAINQCYGAGSKIYISSWFYNDTMVLPAPGLGGSLSEALAQKADDYGVDVRIVIAAPRFSVGIEGRPVGIEDMDHFLSWIGEVGFSNVVHKNIRAVRALRASDPGGGVPLLGRVLIDWGGLWDSRHEKSTVVYSANTNELSAFVGGMDYSPDRVSPEIHTAAKYWHDVGVELRGGAAASVLDNFRTRWEEAATLPPRTYMLDGVAGKFNPFIESSPPTQPTNPPTAPTIAPPGGYIDASVRIVRSYDAKRAYNPWMRQPDLPWATLPAGGVQEVLAVLQKAILAAERYIYVEDQTLNPGAAAELYVTHSKLTPYILDRLGHGVKVIYVTDGFSGPDSPVPANLTMSAEILEGILNKLSLDQAQNFSLHYVANTKVHAKVVMVDDEFVSIGSANFWDRSMTGAESELTAAIVHAGGQNSLVADLRVRLWRGHLRVASSAAVDSELRDLNKSLGIFRSDWGTGVTFAHPNSALRQM
jgi:phosphatidylserine/phosphatidylglycerophosphate/cardiolipin synthase-like enzyme